MSWGQALHALPSSVSLLKSVEEGRASQYLSIPLDCGHLTREDHPEGILKEHPQMELTIHTWRCWTQSQLSLGSLELKKRVFFTVRQAQGLFHIPPKRKELQSIVREPPRSTQPLQALSEVSTSAIAAGGIQHNWVEWRSAHPRDFLGAEMRSCKHTFVVSRCL